jgi:hypothetical protein
MAEAPVPDPHRFPWRHWRPLFLAGVLVLLIAIGWSGKQLFETIDGLRANELGNVAWNATQLEVQLVKVQHLLAEAKAGNPQRLLLQRRWDNLLSWIGPLEASVTADLRTTEPDFVPTLTEIKTALAELEAYVRVRSGNLVQSVDVLEAPLTALAVPIRRLAVMGDQYWDLYIERRRGALVDKIEALSVFAIGLVALLAANQLVLLAQRRRLRTMAVHLGDALAVAEATRITRPAS